MKIAIIDYNAGNVQSVLFALERLGVQPILTSDHSEIKTADKVIFPGVGEASSTMRFLKQNGLDEVIKSLQQPTLGICLGMQLMCSFSEENNTTCLNIFPNKVKRFPDHPKLKVPHMGWNILQNCEGPILEGSESEYVYFAHSYFAEPGPFTKATVQHIVNFSAALQKDNFYALQFHPEKSGTVGAKMLANFLSI